MRELLGVVLQGLASSPAQGDEELLEVTWQFSQWVELKCFIQSVEYLLEPVVGELLHVEVLH